MVLQKRLYYGFDGYQVPAMPRGSRSVRGKGLGRKKNEDNQMCAFELLATVAGRLLQEKDVSPGPCDVEAGRTQENSEEFKDKDNCNRKNGKEFKEKDSCYRKNSEWARLSLGRSSTITRETIKQEPLDEEKMFKVEPCDQGSSDESALASCVGSQQLISQDDGASIPISRLTKSNSLENFTCAEESRFDKGSNVTNSSVDSVFSGPGMLKTMPEKTYGKCGEVKCFPGYDESCEGKIEDENDTKLVSDPQRIGNTVNGTAPGVCSSDEPMELDTKTNALVSSDSSVDVPLCNEYIPCSSFPRCSDDVKKVVSRDDDENSSGCTQPSTASVQSFRPSCIGDRKIRKMLDSEFWKVGSTLLNDGEISNTDMDVKPVFRSRKACYTRQRTQRCSASKRRKLFDRNLIATSDEGIACEVICNSPEKGIDVEALGSGATMHKESEPSSPVPVTKSSFKSGESHVKLSIKSFRVPEFFIEMPETATVATLKKTVMDAVTAMILGGGLTVGVHLQGKKVRDDNKTLIQTGISQDDKLDSVGFVLEPNHPPASLPCPNVLSSSATQPITRYSTVTPLEQVVADATPSPLVTSPGSWAESDHDSVISLTDDLSLEKASPDSRALVALPTMSMGTLAVIPLHRKLRRAELVQRRIRRPFSVSEVEALVQAVEKLGTGRWRDVKLWAFDSAKHRTYVDLKDKWKTLVHTARISPQQRRGEPVPQELLDRVLQAHAYWSQQQAKQQAKQQTEACLLL